MNWRSSSSSKVTNLNNNVVVGLEVGEPREKDEEAKKETWTKQKVHQVKFRSNEEGVCEVMEEEVKKEEVERLMFIPNQLVENGTSWVKVLVAELTCQAVMEAEKRREVELIVKERCEMAILKGEAFSMKEMTVVMLCFYNQC